MTPIRHANLPASRPHDAKALYDFRAMIREIGAVVLRQMHRPPPNVGGGLRDWVRAAQAGNDVTRLGMRRQRQLADLFLTPIADLLRGWFENPHIQAAFAFDAVVGNHASLHAPGTAYGLLHHALGEVAGRKGVWGHAIGGMGAITRAMLAQARALGVVVETGAEVVEVVVEAGRAQGSVLADGSVRRAKSIAANLAPKLLYLDLIDRSVLDADFRSRIDRTRTESAVLRINVALSELPGIHLQARRRNTGPPRRRHSHRPDARLHGERVSGRAPRRLVRASSDRTADPVNAG